MRSRVELTVALEESDLTRALILGQVSLDGLTVKPLLVGTEERHERMVSHAAFDACEFSMAQYLALKDMGRCVFMVIPVFPRRMFGQRLLFARAGAGIRGPQDLAGRRVLLSRYQNSLALWLRGYLLHEYGVAPHDIQWVRRRKEAIEFEMPRGISLTEAPAGSTVEDLLMEGVVDAVMTPLIPNAFLRGSPLIKRVFSDVRRVETEYFMRTRDFPIMHLVVVRNAVLDEHPWVAVSLRELFDRSKQAYFEYASQPFRLGLAFGGAQQEEERALMGADPWPYTIEDNRVSLNLLTEYAWEQDLTSRRLQAADLFVRG